MIFKVEKAAKIYLLNSTFTKINQVEFQYEKRSLLYNSYTTEYFIENNMFDNTDRFDQMYSALLKFSPRAVGSDSFFVDENYSLNNLTVKNDTFLIGNDPSFSPSAHPKNKRSAIAINRKTDNQSVKNIYINNNIIEMKGQRVMAIDFAHDFPKYTKEGNSLGNPYLHYNMKDQSLYADNKNIFIEKNKIVAESIYPHYGIFIQGPYSNVNVNHNILLGFGLTSIQNDEIRAEGSIDLYGSRKNSFYSYNLQNSKIQFNQIQSFTNGIRVTGSMNTLIHKNDITVFDWPEGLDLSSNPAQAVPAGIRVQAGDSETSGIGSQDIEVTYNSINVKNIPQKVGIIVNQSKNYKIENNSIDNLKSVGIYTYINTPNNDAMGLGISYIKNNTMDYENNSHSENISGGPIFQVDNKAIVLQRQYDNYPSGEKMYISGNKVEADNALNYYYAGYNNVHKHGDWGNVNFPTGSSINVAQKNEQSAAVKHVTSGDFDGDGLDEYVIRNNDNEYFVIFTDDHSYPSFDVQHWSSIPIFWGDSNYESKLKTGDINGDGKDDLVFLNKGNNGKFSLRVALSTGGSFQQYRGYNFPSFFDSYPYLSMAIGNFNNDNEDEIAIRTPDNNFYIIHLNNGSLSRYSVWEDPNISNDSWYEPYMESGDFNDDGYDDLYFLRRGNDGKWIVRVMVYDSAQNGFDGQSGYSSTEIDAVFGATNSYIGFAVADFDGDQKADITLRHKHDKYYVIKSNGSQLHSMELWKDGYIMWGDSNHRTDILPGNIDNNGRMDLFVWSQNNAGTYYFRAAKSQSNTGDKFHRFSGWLINFDSDGGVGLTPSKVNSSTGVEEDEGSEIPEEFELLQNYPNPFNPVTIINFSIPQRSEVKLKIFDLQGRLVKTLVNETKSSGNYSVSFDASNLSSGIYFYTLVSGNYSETKKLTLIK